MSNIDSTENWKQIPGDDIYQVSDIGNIRNGNTGLVLSTWVTRHGYTQVNIKGKHRVYVHRIVAQVWCIGYKKELHVNHKDGVKTNNHPSNLEWVTRSQNQKHRFSSLNHKGPCLGKFGVDHVKSKAVISINLLTWEKKYYASAMDAVREGFTSSQISRVCNGKSSKHKGCSWHYATAALRGVDLPGWVDDDGVIHDKG